MTTTSNEDKKSVLVRCDTCGKLVSTVSRVVIDNGYDRSMAKAIYNCPECFAKKNQIRHHRSGVTS